MYYARVGRSAAALIDRGGRGLDHDMDRAATGYSRAVNRGRSPPALRLSRSLIRARLAAALAAGIGSLRPSICSAADAARPRRAGRLTSPPRVAPDPDLQRRRFLPRPYSCWPRGSDSISLWHDRRPPQGDIAATIATRRRIVENE